MIGTDPNHAMNSFNPLLMMSIGVMRKTQNGNVHGPQQALSPARCAPNRHELARLPGI